MKHLNVGMKLNGMVRDYVKITENGFTGSDREPSFCLISVCRFSGATKKSINLAAFHGVYLFSKTDS